MIIADKIKRSLKLFKKNTTSDFLIIVTILLIILILTIVIMGYYPGANLLVSVNESKIYWKNTRPLAIVDWNYDGKLNIVFKSYDLEPLKIHEFFFGNKKYIIDKKIGSGDKYVFSTDWNCESREKGYYIELTYVPIRETFYKRFVGKKPLILRCYAKTK